jgi:hypothetical protein
MYRIVLASTLLTICSQAVAQDPTCNSTEQTASYTAYYESRKTTDPASQKKAYEAAQLYLQQWAKCDDKYTKSAREFIDFYELTNARLELHDLIFGSTPNHTQAFAVGEKILARQPDDLYTLMSLSFAGNAALQRRTNTFVADTLIYAKKAAHLIETGKTTTNWAPFKTKQDALGYLYYWIGEAYWPTGKDPDAALPFYLKAATTDSALKKDASVFARLADVYQLSVYEKVRQEYGRSNVPFESKQHRMEVEKLNQVVDRLIDYYARAVNAAGTDPKYARKKTEWREYVSVFYKFRHNGTTDGLEDYIANVMNSPLPKP